MPVRPEVLNAISGGGLTADDYAGLTPEQISAVAGQGQKDRQIMLGTVMEMSQQELADRKQQQDELHQDRMFKMMQRQDARADFETMNKTMLDQAQLALAKQRMSLEAAQTKASINASNISAEMHSFQLNKLKSQEDLIGKMKDVKMDVPGYTDESGKPLKMSVGDIYTLGALDKVISANVKKDALTKAGQSKQIELREFIAEQAKKLGASEQMQNIIKMAGPEVFKGWNKANVMAMHKNDPLWNTKSAEEKETIINQELSMADMLKISTLSYIAENPDTGSVVPDGGDKPKGKVPPPPTNEQLKNLMLNDNFDE